MLIKGGIIMATVESSINSIQMTTYAELHLSKGTKIRVQSYALRAWSDGIKIYSESFSKEFANNMRIIQESVKFEICEAIEDGWIQISKERPATIIALDSEEIYATPTAYFCSEVDIIPTPYAVSDELSKNAETGNFLQSFKNPNRKKVFLEFDGALIEKILQPGETVNIRQGYWFAMEGGLTIRVIPEGVCVRNKADSSRKVFIKAYKERW